MIEILDKYKGCLTGLAIGDCLGAPFEFKSLPNIEAYLASHELDMIDFSMFNDWEIYFSYILNFRLIIVYRNWFLFGLFL